MTQTVHYEMLFIPQTLELQLKVWLSGYDRRGNSKRLHYMIYRGWDSVINYRPQSHSAAATAQIPRSPQHPVYI